MMKINRKEKAKMVKKNNYNVFYDYETGKPVVVIAGLENYNRAKQIANNHYKVSVGSLRVCYAKIENKDTVMYDISKKDANAVAIIKD